MMHITRSEDAQNKAHQGTKRPYNKPSHEALDVIDRTPLTSLPISAPIPKPAQHPHPAR